MGDGQYICTDFTDWENSGTTYTFNELKDHLDGAATKIEGFVSDVFKMTKHFQMPKPIEAEAESQNTNTVSFEP